MAVSIFDTHAHYTSAAFDADRDALLQALPGQGVVGVCDCATHSADAVRSLALAHRYPFVYTAVGIHPESLIEPDAATLAVYKGDWQAELRAMEPLFADPKVVAVGECGMDFHWPIPADAQQALFRAQLELARRLDKPALVHDRQAHEAVYALLREFRPRGIVHCFSGSAEDARWLAAQGMLIGFGGALTFTGAKRAVKALAALDLSQIVLETDCPYMAPQPLRGQRCHSGMIAHVAEFIAREKDLPTEQVYQQTTANARRVFGLTQQ